MADSARTSLGRRELVYPVGKGVGRGTRMKRTTSSPPKKKRRRRKRVREAEITNSIQHEVDPHPELIVNNLPLSNFTAFGTYSRVAMTATRLGISLSQEKNPAVANHKKPDTIIIAGLQELHELKMELKKRKATEWMNPVEATDRHKQCNASSPSSSELPSYSALIS